MLSSQNFFNCKESLFLICYTSSLIYYLKVFCTEKSWKDISEKLYAPRARIY